MTRPTPALRKARDLNLQLGTELKTATDELAATQRTLAIHREQTSAIMVDRDTTKTQLKAERERTSALNDEITRLRETVDILTARHEAGLEDRDRLRNERAERAPRVIYADGPREPLALDLRAA